MSNRLNRKLESTPRKIDKFAALGMGFSQTEQSILDYGEMLWNMIGKPVLTPSYQGANFPIGEDTNFTIERGYGLYGQEERPDMISMPRQDLKFTLSKVI
tara:strand:+ start:969 stop:1268 length:300 start_codon:yes stop_codon:yes gene_type:complete